MINIEKDKKNMCCGCTACANICPKEAITMEEDFEGFLYPTIDKTKCIDCGICDKVCPLKNKIKKEKVKKAYVVQHTNNEILKNSTSGGAFVSIAEYVINNNGVVFGAGFDEEFTLMHIEVNNMEELRKVQGSKYIQSDLRNTYKRIKKILNDKKYVLFTGTPCQVSGLKHFLGKDYEKLITIDLVCRSVPSPKIWKLYLRYMENKYGDTAHYVKFRDKSYGYHGSTLTIGFKNRKVYRGSNRVCIYGSLFHGDKISRPSCYDCKFKEIERCSDFTLFDSWKSEKLNKLAVDNNKGYTNVFIHTNKGLEIFEKVKEKMSTYEINYKEAILYTGGMVEKSIDKPKEREEIYSDLDKMEFSEFSKKYNTSTFKDYIFEYSKTILYKIGILRKIQKLKKD